MKLTGKQNIVFRECLNAVVNGPFIPEWEFPILFGLEKKEIGAILAQWESIDHNEDSVNLAINNALINLLGYPIDSPEEWNNFISVNNQELLELYEAWKQRL
jgi:hypothetical protein